MPKVWVRTAYSDNPHPADPCEAYRNVFQAVSDARATLDQMLFDTDNGVQYLLITTPTEESAAGLMSALDSFNAELVHSNLSDLGEMRSNGGSSAA